MEFLQLQAFSILAHYENMSVAAQQLNTSQPQISKLLSSLEAELGVQLFDRVGRGIRLNEHGRLFIQYANDALTIMQSGQTAMQQLKNAILGTVTFGAFAFAPILSDCAKAYSLENPHVSFHWHSSGAPGYSNINTIDILLSPSKKGHYNYENHFPVSRTILKENYYIVISPKLKKFPSSKTSINIQETLDLPYIVMGQEGLYKNNDYDLVYEISESLGKMPKITYGVNEFAFKMLLVSRGEGLTLLPEACLDMARMIVPDLQVFSIENFSTERTVIIARKKRAALSNAANDFWDYALNYFGVEPDRAE